MTLIADYLVFGAMRLVGGIVTVGSTVGAATYELHMTLLRPESGLVWAGIETYVYGPYATEVAAREAAQTVRPGVFNLPYKNNEGLASESTITVTYVPVGGDSFYYYPTAMSDFYV